MRFGAQTNGDWPKKLDKLSWALQSSQQGLPEQEYQHNPEYKIF